MFKGVAVKGVNGLLKPAWREFDQPELASKLFPWEMEKRSGINRVVAKHKRIGVQGHPADGSGLVRI